MSGRNLSTGEEVRLDHYRGKLVLVDFWASWCPPCLESLPAWEALHHELGPQGFRVIGVNVDENTEDGLRFLDHRPVSFPIIADPAGEIGIPWGVRTLPRYFLIDQSGLVVSDFRRFNTRAERRLEHEIRKRLDPVN